MTRLLVLEEAVQAHEEVVGAITHGLAHYRDRLLAQRGFSKYDQVIGLLAQRVRDDPDLRLPHRKLLDALAASFDHQQGVFAAVQFSRLVRLARVGKGMAGEYLQLLLVKGYVAARSDGYRKYYWLHSPQNTIKAQSRGGLS